MRAYSIFDDYPKEAVELLNEVGVNVTVHPLGVPRPSEITMKDILLDYDIVIIGTSQKLSENMMSEVASHKIIATASVGTDHIKIPTGKEKFFTVLNTPKANAQSVAEYTIGCALNCVKRMNEGKELYEQKKDNKQLIKKPEDLYGKTIGIVGAGLISQKIMEYARFFGMKVVCWTAHPENHSELISLGVRFVELDELAKVSNVVSVNLPNNADTVNFINADFIDKMKNDSILISVSRLDTIDWRTLLKKAELNKNFYVNLDIDLDNDVAESLSSNNNVQITPHIAGGTIETRKRMFLEIASRIVEMVE